jgi:hypothetical protein
LGLAAFLTLCAMAFSGAVLADDKAAGKSSPPSDKAQEMADVVRLSNGNKIVGHLMEISDGIAVIHIDSVGEMEIPLSDITSITKRPYVPPPALSPAERRAQEERIAQQRKDSERQYQQYAEALFRRRAFDEDCRRQAQMEADWREFLKDGNLNSRFQEDMFFLRFGPLYRGGCR